MGRYKYLLKNLGLLTLGQFGTKLLSFFLVPLYTDILTTPEYGTYDLFTTTVNLMIPILTLNVADSITVFALDKKNYDKNVLLWVGIKYTFISTLIVTVLTVLNWLFDIIKLFNEFWFFLPVLFALSVFSSVLTNFARGLERVKEIAIGGVLSSFTMILLNILFLLFLKLGLLGYFLATLIGLFVQVIYLALSCKIWRYTVVKNSKPLEKDMISYSKPLIANSISWWINNSSDRYVVTTLCGVAENGIYSVGYKIPSILNVVQTIFAQAWSISAIKEFDPEDKDGFFATMYSVYNYVLTFACSMIIVFSKHLAYFLYKKEFFVAWRFVPLLTISIIFGALAGFLGGFFAAVKDSKSFARSTVISAVVNTVLNIILVYLIGPIGAAIATAVCYFVVWVIRLYEIKKYIKLKIQFKRDLLCYSILLVQTIILLFVENIYILYATEFVCLFVILFLFKKENKHFLAKFKDVINKRKNSNAEK